MFHLAQQNYITVDLNILKPRVKKIKTKNFEERRTRYQYILRGKLKNLHVK